jgi:hypothetical protein
MNNLVVLNPNALADAGINASVSFTKKQGEEASGIKTRSFHPFLQLIQPTSRNVPDTVNPGSLLMKYGGSDENPVNLGNKFRAFVISVRGKATFFDKANNKVKAEYAIPNATGDGQDVTSLYLEYKTKAEEEESAKLQNKSYARGLEVLMYLPDQRTFATYFANTVTTVQSVLDTISPYGADFSAGRTGTLVNMFTVKKETTKGKWYIVEALEIDDEEVMLEIADSMPSSDEYMSALTGFIKPKASSDYNEAGIEGAEKADETVAKRSR